MIKTNYNLPMVESLLHSYSLLCRYCQHLSNLKWISFFCSCHDNDHHYYDDNVDDEDVEDVGGDDDDENDLTKSKFSYQILGMVTDILPPGGIQVQSALAHALVQALLDDGR